MKAGGRACFPTPASTSPASAGSMRGLDYRATRIRMESAPISNLALKLIWSGAC
jgi:hypothetical protein